MDAAKSVDKTWTPNHDSRKSISVFENNILAESWGILEVQFPFNQQTAWVWIKTHMICECQLWLQEHVAQYTPPWSNLANWIASVKDNPATRWSHPQKSICLSKCVATRPPAYAPLIDWLIKQVDGFCWKLLGMGRGPAWSLGLRNSLGWPCRVGKKVPVAPVRCIPPLTT